MMDTPEITRKLVEQYIRFFAESPRQIEALRDLLSESFIFESPLGRFSTADSFVQDLKRNLLDISSVHIRQIIADANSACALYEVQSSNEDIGRLIFSEWFEVNEGKILSVKSTFDASDIKKSLAEI